ncbi:MAG: hypothetical protein GX660_04670 [Clostridiaceae bacterium]|nr:hypothetical protein [Clostridiaceae bacterium]
MSTKLFDGFDLTDGEDEFISNVLKDDKMLDVKSVYMQQAQILATLRYAKELERASIASNKQACIMKWLTGALVFFAAVEALAVILEYW